MQFMQSDYLVKSSCTCSSAKKLKTKKPVFPIMTSILLAIIPKCPYCILAYSSAITMCSGSKIYTTSPNWTSYFLLALAMLTLVSVLLNYKGNRTIIATSLITLGTLLMLGCQLYTFNISHYYLGTFLILFGVWVNASFRFFYRKWILPAFNSVFIKMNKWINE